MKKIITLLLLASAVFASCKKEEIQDLNWFKIDVIQGSVIANGVELTPGFKPVVNSDTVVVECPDRCVYVVNGNTYESSNTFNR